MLFSSCMPDLMCQVLNMDLYLRTSFRNSGMEPFTQYCKELSTHATLDLLLAPGLVHPAANACCAGRGQGVPQLIRGEVAEA